MQNNIFQQISSLMKGAKSGNPMSAMMSLFGNNNPQIQSLLNGGLTPQSAKQQIQKMMENGQISNGQWAQLNQMAKGTDLEGAFDKVLEELHVDKQALEKEPIPQQERPKSRF